MKVKLVELKNAGFGDRGRRRIPYEDNLEKFVIITQVGGGSFGGKYVGMSLDGNMVFGPYEATEYGVLGRRKIMKDDHKQFNPRSVEGIEEVTEETLEQFCSQTNREELEKAQKNINDHLKLSLYLRY